WQGGGKYAKRAGMDGKKSKAIKDKKRRETGKNIGNQVNTVTTNNTFEALREGELNTIGDKEIAGDNKNYSTAKEKTKNMTTRKKY
ncbi:hypothetical protein HAX54_019423, partial [Datura stramonium]|nr:hypothetical protein [Datura stramonium]